ncbi:MAG: dephospho-CoA kinase [Cyclobacteriaceae bacterium]|nr:dephospho-CoA kinase [Cyclobacteriaceae bacterium]
MQNNGRALNIGITGGIGAGKTLISLIFKNLGIPVYYADERARYLMNHDDNIAGKIREMFGTEAFLNGTLNRKYLAREVFSQAEKLEQLNRLVHPAVNRDYREWVSRQKNNPYCLKEAALLFETGSYRDLDQTILVYAPEHIRINRILMRDPYRLKEDVETIIRNQMDDEDKKKLADFIIFNDDDRLVIPQVLKIHKMLVSMQVS